MEIKLPYKWIKEYVKTDLSAMEFAKAVSLGGPSIEKWNLDESIEDNIFEIEVTPHRTDMASVIGIAREASAILPTELLYKEVEVNLNPSKKIDFKVSVLDQELCPRYSSIVVDNVKVSESPKWIQDRLKAAGLNSHNNIVDITNYVLLEYGQPVHAFDYEKLKGNEIIVRRATDGEKFVSLDEKEYELDSNTLVIADSENAVALAGIKGGLNSGIDSNTKTIVIEVANFEPVNIRKTWRRLDLQTDASSLNEKGLNIGLTLPALKRVVQLVLELAGGEIVSELIDVKKEELKPKVVEFNINEVDRILGIQISKEEIISILERLGFSSVDNGDVLNVTVPYYREADIDFDYDLVEEIARIYGYHKIPSELPTGVIPKVRMSDDLVWEERIKDMLAGIGLTETIAYSMISKKQLDVVEIDESEVLQVTNPLTSDFVYMRSELASTMIEITSRNESYEDKVKIFNLDKVYLPTDEKSLPIEQSNLSILVNGDKIEDTFYELKGYFEFLLDRIGINKKDVVYDSNVFKAPYKKGASANIIVDGINLGIIGMISDSATSMFGIKKHTALLEINFDEFLKIILKTVKSYKPIPKFPSVSRDFAFIVDEKLNWSEVYSEVKNVSGDLFVDSELFDIYKGKNIEAGKKSIAFNLTIQSLGKTLTDEEINSVVEKISKMMEEKFGGVMRD